MLEVENLIRQDLSPESIKYHYDEAKARIEKLTKELKETERILELKAHFEAYAEKTASEALKRIKTKDFFKWLQIPQQLKDMDNSGLIAMKENYLKDLDEAKEKLSRLEPFKDKEIEQKTKYIG